MSPFVRLMRHNIKRMRDKGGLADIARFESFIEIYRNDYAALRAIAYNIVRNRDDADDVMQSVMIKLVEKREELDHVASPQGFLRRCIRNEAVSLLRHRQLAALPIGGDAVSDMSPQSDANLERIENLAYIKTYIKKQPEEIQEAFISYVLDGYKIVDLAEELGMPPKRLERRFRRIIADIRRAPGVRFTVFFII